jgi:hypothetical protein
MQQIALLFAMEETNQWHRRLLRARNERRCDYRAAKCDKEFSPSHHSISSFEFGGPGSAVP